MAEAEQYDHAVYTTKTGAKSLERLVTIAKKVSVGIEAKELEDIEVIIDGQETEPRKKLLALRWYGGKYSHLDWLLPLLPKTTQYCEAFGGSAAVLLNKDPSQVETYNDIDGILVNFFKVLRDKPEQLIEKVYLTPFSREEFTKAYESRGRTDLNDIEKARLFFVSAEQVRIGLAQTATPGRWAWCVLTSRRGMSGAVSRWLNRIEGLWAVSERLRLVQIENMDALEVLQKYDSEETLFYCDPPYPHESRGDIKAYGYEMKTEQHAKLAKALHKLKGKIALSGYKTPLLERLYPDWQRIDAPEMIAHSVKQLRQESLWVNYDIQSIGKKNVEASKRNGVTFSKKGHETLSNFV